MLARPVSLLSTVFWLIFDTVLKFLILTAALTAWAAYGDQVEMKNGDHFTGRVVSLTADSIVLENDNLGKVTLPRSKVSLLSIGHSATAVAVPAPTNPPPPIVKSTATNANDDIAGALRQLGANTNFIAKIKGQFLAGAGPEANQKFDDTLAGLMSGNIDMAGLRSQAKSAADQLRAYQREAGPEGGDTMNTYLVILDNFLRETASATNR
jgi:hypothetical protein